MNPEDFIEFLEESLANPETPLAAMGDKLQTLEKTSDPAELKETVASLIEVLARPDRYGRQKVVTALSERGEEVTPALLELMEDERLAIRAAAVAVLQRIRGVSLDFQPFDDEEARMSQLQLSRDQLAAEAPSTQE